MAASAFALLSASRLVLIVMFIWLLILIVFFVLPFYYQSEVETISSSNPNNDLILARLNRASIELNSLRNQNYQLREIIDTIRPLKLNRPTLKPISEDAVLIEERLNQQSELTPNSKQLTHIEQLTLLQNNLNELRRFVLNGFPKNDSSNVHLLKEHFFDLFNTIERLEERDQFNKRKYLAQLRDRVLNAIEVNQNPTDCKTARKLVCQLNKGCGFGCQMHHVSFCLISALATGRTLILKTNNWRYTPLHQLEGTNTNGWELVFQALSNSCKDSDGLSRSLWKLKSEEYQVVDMPIIDAIHPSPPFVPLAIPSQIESELIKLHSTPYVWFVGQIIGYILRPSKLMQEYIDKAKTRLKFKNPIVGIQVRRTDKLGTEASLHKLSEYMQKVSDYYDYLDYQNMKQQKERVERRVYLATDESALWHTEVPSWEKKGYIFVGDSEIAKTAGLKNRYSIASLKNIILDIFLLSQSDHLVCTFSSQVCRLAFELMQTRGMDLNDSGKVDFSNAYDSLDDIYYFGGQRPHNQIAVAHHQASSSKEVDLEIGDKVGIAGNHWNGFSKGVNRRTNANGLFPSFKTKDLIETFPFKAFDKSN